MAFICSDERRIIRFGFEIEIVTNCNTCGDSTTNLGRTYKLPDGIYDDEFKRR